MDVFDGSIKDAFHLLMFGCLKVMPLVDKVVVLSEFNAEFGHGWDSSIGAVG
jgi:hypothetical protein